MPFHIYQMPVVDNEHDPAFDYKYVNHPLCAWTDNEGNDGAEALQVLLGYLTDIWKMSRADFAGETGGGAFVPFNGNEVYVDFANNQTGHYLGYVDIVITSVPDGMDIEFGDSPLIYAGKGAFQHRDTGSVTVVDGEGTLTLSGGSLPNIRRGEIKWINHFSTRFYPAKGEVWTGFWFKPKPGVSGYLSASNLGFNFGIALDPDDPLQKRFRPLQFDTTDPDNPSQW